jgi:acyl-CoA thioesterase I
MKKNNSKPVKILFFGDSICVGQGASINKGWVPLIANYLDENVSTIARDILVINSSVNGRTTRQALEDMPYHVQGQKPDIIVIQYGFNDCNHWETDGGLPRVSQRAFVANLNEMVERATRFGAKFILLNNNHSTTLNAERLPQTNYTYEDFNQQYNAATRALADKLKDKVVFQDVESYFHNLVKNGADMHQFLLDDGLHLGEEGHRVYYDLMKPAIISAVEDLLRK